MLRRRYLVRPVVIDRTRSKAVGLVVCLLQQNPDNSFSLPMVNLWYLKVFTQYLLF